jgi:ornithine cyclodeaminase/alanine dehydrogenase-like protein (mu-crystallin family)
MVTLLDTATVDRYLDTELALDTMRHCFRLEHEGRAGPAERTDLPHPDGWMRVLPAVFEGLGVFGHKVISFHRERGVRYVITLFDIESGDLRAVVDAEAITGARTGATAALAADLLCRPAVGVAAIIGTGSVARTQLPALQAVRPADEIRVYSRNPLNRAEFVAEMQPCVETKLVVVDTAEAAYDGAGLVTLATKSPTAVFARSHLEPGMHVSSVGSARPNLSELEPDAFDVFDIVACDSVHLVFAESGDAIAAVESGLFDESKAVDLASLVALPVPRDDHDTTLFKSTGTGLQDLSLALAVLDRAVADGAGTAVDDVLALKAFGPTGRT